MRITLMLHINYWCNDLLLGNLMANLTFMYIAGYK
jgi:hypothetical protein